MPACQAACWPDRLAFTTGEGVDVVTFLHHLMAHDNVGDDTRLSLPPSSPVDII